MGACVYISITSTGHMLCSTFLVLSEAYDLRNPAELYLLLFSLGPRFLGHMQANMAARSTFK